MKTSEAIRQPDRSQVAQSSFNTQQTENQSLPTWCCRTKQNKGKQESGLLPDVLEERAGQHRQVELDVEDDEEYSEKASPDPHLEKLSGVCHDGRREQE